MEEDWPGNVRQLKQTLYKIAQVSDTREISFADVQRALGSSGKKQTIQTYREAKGEVLLDFERKVIW